MPRRWNGRRLFRCPRHRSSSVITDPGTYQTTLTFAGEPTYSVSDLTAELREFLGESWSGVWVAGEVQRLRESRSGHVYFELIEKGPADRIIGKVDAVLWARDAQRVRRTLSPSDQDIGEGLEIRCRGGLDFYPPAGRLQFVVREIDPAFSLGHLELRRRQTLAVLEKAGLVGRNRQISLPKLPLRIGLVTSDGSAAFHDFVTTVVESGYRFRIYLAHASMQGARAEADVVRALARLEQLRQSLDALVIVRGGGSRTDLAAFDSRKIATAIAECDLPVMTGLGHENDETIADLVCHTACKTPTGVAEFLTERVGRAETELTDHERRMVQVAARGLQRAAASLERLSPLSRAFRLRLQAGRHQLDELSHKIVNGSSLAIAAADHRSRSFASHLWRSASAQLTSAHRASQEMSQQLKSVARSRLREQTTRLSGIERSLRQLQPERVLRRGFSITRRADGTILGRSDGVTPGEIIQTQLAEGELRSRVERK